MLITKKIYSIEEITKLLEPVFKAHRIKKAILFGSYVRGEANSWSDVDIAVEYTDTFWGIEDSMVRCCQAALIKRVDVIDIDGRWLKDSIKNAISREGVLIYG